MSVTTNYGWPLPEDRERLFEIFMRERLIEIDADLFGARALVYHNANQSIANSTDTALAFNTERADTHAFHSTVTNTSRLTIPADMGGVYLITSNVFFDANVTGQRALAIRLNGASFIAGVNSNATGGGTAATNLSLAKPYPLVVGDYIEAIVNQSSGGALNVVTSIDVPSFSIHKIG